MEVSPKVVGEALAVGEVTEARSVGFRYLEVAGKEEKAEGGEEETGVSGLSGVEWRMSCLPGTAHRTTGQ